MILTHNVLGCSLAHRRERTLTSAQLGLEHSVQGLYPAKVSHQVHVLRVRLAPDGLQRLHVHAAHADGEQLDAGVAGALGHLLHVVLGPPVRHDDGHLPTEGHRGSECFHISMSKSLLAIKGLNCKPDKKLTVTLKTVNRNNIL